ncbi:MAG: 16S rRNA (adenine(1518)-N(6)/adenine(1519)-N(6))-dimethyltransferase RsmA [Oscillospiraceae bacterium]|jgi:16S rRNA (adenine1518-N6/adenine1519-N6)-dimethyltransferase|nr:16S rRNA (adenine(1518)-N(6)/adenine(1519)-N(6))-dimethyltransferase RsmA [Oscillospiraceae bacterium]
MNNLSDIGQIKDLLLRHGFTFSKSLGQNFLINPHVCPKMAELSGIDKNAGVIEIGSGIGVLTTELASRAKKVVSIEIDKRLMVILNETLSDCPNVQVINADIMKLNLHDLIAEHFKGMKVYVCANLPYYITSPVIMLLLESRLPIESITIMVQKEAGDRLCAAVGSRESGAVTVAVNYYAKVSKLFSVSKGSFMPSPKVDSQVIKLEMRKEPPVKISDEAKFFKVVKSAFAQRRKTVQNAVSSGMAIPKPEVEKALKKSGLDPKVRAEMLNMEQLAELCENLG